MGEHALGIIGTGPPSCQCSPRLVPGVSAQSCVQTFRLDVPWARPDIVLAHNWRLVVASFTLEQRTRGQTRDRDRARVRRIGSNDLVCVSLNRVLGLVDG
jgi:hypothetical protein